MTIDIFIKKLTGTKCYGAGAYSQSCSWYVSNGSVSGPSNPLFANHVSTYVINFKNLIIYSKSCTLSYGISIYLNVV